MLGASPARRGMLMLPNTPTSTWAPVITFNFNMFGFRQHAWIYFSPLMDSNTLSEPNTQLRIFLGPYTDPSIFYIDSIYIILIWIQLKILQEWNYTPALFLHRRRLMSYKYTINPSNPRFTISLFSIFLVYIFLKSISLKYHFTLSL